MVVSVETHKIGQKKRHEAVVDQRCELTQDLERFFIVEGQGGAGGLAHAAETLQKGGVVESVEGEVEKTFPVEARVECDELTGDGAEAGFVKPVFESWRGLGGHKGSILGEAISVSAGSLFKTESKSIPRQGISGERFGGVSVPRESLTRPRPVKMLVKLPMPPTFPTPDRLQVLQEWSG